MAGAKGRTAGDHTGRSCSPGNSHRGGGHSFGQEQAGVPSRVRRSESHHAATPGFLSWNELAVQAQTQKGRKPSGECVESLRGNAGHHGGIPAGPPVPPAPRPGHSACRADAGENNLRSTEGRPLPQEST